MARLQILELPEGADDKRPPFVLIVDEYAPRRYVMGAGQTAQSHSEFDGVAETIGARAVLTFAEQVEIPANELLPTEPFELVGDIDRMDQITDALGIDRLRDWGEIITALTACRGSAGLYAEMRTAKGGE